MTSYGYSLDNRISLSLAHLIKEHRKALGLTQQQLASSLGVSKNLIGHWESQRTKPDLDLIPRLCHILRIPLLELFNISDSIVHLSESEKSHIELYRSLTPYNRIIIDKLTHSLQELQPTASSPTTSANIRRIWHNMQKTAAGLGNPLMAENIGEYVYLYDSPLIQRADEIITITGDSMSPTFTDGDCVLVEHTSSVRPGEIGVFIFDGEGYIKEFRKDGLYSHNSNYPILTFCDNDTVICLGRVLSIVTKSMYASDLDIELYKSTSK